MKRLVLLPLLPAVAALVACAPTYSPGQSVTLADGEICTVLGRVSQGTRLDCPTRGVIVADIQTPNINEQLNPEIAPGIQLSDVPGVPNIPVIPLTQAEAECRAGQYAQNRVRGAAEGAVLGAIGLPGNTLGIIRRSQRIAARIEGRPNAATADPCANL
ncbi:hypothetical protein KUL25_07395 [Rhodobacteraceae bacterium N5(2021)]|uniref:Uncharacterized protein n=1 Tax=Gymnodinialimonas phycosphaerae TaxID=2841589 RepID=A0A975TXN8_9RHOB|nr:hypothetical protein [Gymnodinialimonas phycosphaerae]MBY4892587.1 hypothetical protein [Gymnodinialimonas phycosphaerae]